MTTSDVIGLCRSRGIALIPDAARLKFRAPIGALDDQLRAELVAHKADILVRLGIAADPDAEHCFQERAAIMEYEGGLTRDQAEAAALAAAQFIHPCNARPIVPVCS